MTAVPQDRFVPMYHSSSVRPFHRTGVELLDTLRNDVMRNGKPAKFAEIDTGESLFVIRTRAVDAAGNITWQRRKLKMSKVKYDMDRRFQKHKFRVDDMVEVRRVSKDPRVRDLHPVRAETAPDREVYAVTTRREVQAGQVIGLMSGTVISEAAAPRLAHPLIFFLSDAKVSLDCRSGGNELCLINPPEGFEDGDEDTRVNAAYVSWFCGKLGLPTLGVFALKDMRAGEEVLCVRDANYWEFTKRHIVDDLKRYAWERYDEIQELSKRMRGVVPPPGPARFSEPPPPPPPPTPPLDSWITDEEEEDENTKVIPLDTRLE